MEISDEEFDRDLKAILDENTSSDSSVTGLHFGSSSKKKLNAGKRISKQSNVSLPSWYTSGGGADDLDDDLEEVDEPEDWFNVKSKDVKPSIKGMADVQKNAIQPDVSTQQPSNVVSTSEDGFLDDYGDGILMKKDEDTRDQLAVSDKANALTMSRDSLETGALKSDEDTINEIEEKKKFFDLMDKKYKGQNVSYGKLNDDLDNSDDSALPTIKYPTVSSENDEMTKVKTEKYDSIDQEDTNDGNRLENQHSKGQAVKSTMLSKVSLMDSLESTLQRSTKDDDYLDDTLKFTTTAENIDDKAAAVDEYNAIKKALEKAVLHNINDASDNVNVAKIREDDDPSLQESLMGFEKDMEKSKDKTTSEFTVHDNEDEIMVDDSSGHDDNLNLYKSQTKQGELIDTTEENKGSSDIFDNEVETQDFNDQQKVLADQLTKSSNEAQESRGFDLRLTDTDSDSSISVTKSASMEKKIKAAKEKHKNSNTKQKGKTSINTTNLSSLHNSNVAATHPSINFIERNKANIKRKELRAVVDPSGTPQKEGRSTPIKKNATKNLSKVGTNIPVANQNKQVKLLAASVESFSNYLHNVIGKPSISAASPKVSKVESSSVNETEITRWQNAWKEEKDKVEKLMEDIKIRDNKWMQQQKIFQLDMEEKVHNLKQENFILHAKIQDYEEQVNTRKRIAGGGNLEGATDNELKLLEKDVRDQESLLKGYQTENKRLYDELKTMQSQNKGFKKKMFEENERLKVEIMSLKNKMEATGQHEQKTGPVVIGAGKIAELEAELTVSKERECNLKEQVERLEIIKDELEKHINKLVLELTEYKSNIQEGKMVSADDLNNIKDIHKKDMSVLNEKLKWYAENQQLLDRDSREIKEKNQRIKELSEQVNSMQVKALQEVKENEEYIRQTKMYEQRIKDLQRQVKEMDEVIKRRFPNSLSALIYATSSNNESANTESKTNHSVVYLENRVKQLEEELKENQKESERSVRSLQQLNSSLKIKYEDRLKELESQLETATDRLSRLTGEYHQRSVHPFTRIQTIEKELESLKDRNKQRDEHLIVSITTVLEILSSVNVAVDGGGEVKKFKEENETKYFDKSTGKDDIDSLIKKLIYASKLKVAEIKDIKNQYKNIQKNTQGTGKKKRLTSGKSGKKLSKNLRAENTKPPIDKSFNKQPYMSSSENELQHQDGKAYNPRHLLESELKDISDEKELLEKLIARMESEHERSVKLLQDQLSTEKVAHEKTKEVMVAQMDTEKRNHKEVLEKYLKEHSHMSFSEKNAKIESQKILIEELRQKLAEANKKAKAVELFQQREASLKHTVSELKEELSLLKNISSPESQHFNYLLSKVNFLEKKYTDREVELNGVVNYSNGAAELEFAEKEDKWQRILLSKNEQINAFRQELDNMMETLRTLQRQGVVISFGT